MDEAVSGRFPAWERNPTSASGFPPRPTIQALRLDLSEGVIRQSLENNGLLVHPGATVGAHVQIRVVGLMHQLIDRLAAWLIRTPEDS